MVRPRIFKLAVVDSHYMEMTPIVFEVTRSKIKVTVNI